MRARASVNFVKLRNLFNRKLRFEIKKQSDDRLEISLNLRFTTVNPLLSPPLKHAPLSLIKPPFSPPCYSSLINEKYSYYIFT